MIQGLKYCLFALVLITTNNAFGKFAGVPNVQKITEVFSYRDAVKKLFRSTPIKIKKIEEGGGQQAATYRVNHQGKKWFVKIVHEDCESCDSTHFETEWPSKKQKKDQQRLKVFGIEFVYPNKGALFNFKGKLHYIASYPLIEGQTLSFYFDKYLDTDASVYRQINHPLYKALSRYGTASAHLHFEPGAPSTSVATLLSRPAVHYLPDRNWSNELYDQNNNKIWFIDFADDTETFGKQVNVKSSLEDLFNSFYFIEGDKPFSSNDYIILIHYLDIFTDGYTAALPAYDQNVLRKMLQLTLVHVLREACVSDEKSSCPEADFLQRYYLLTDEEMERAL